MSKEIQKIHNKKLSKNKLGKLDLLSINTQALSASLDGLSIPRLFYQLIVFVLDGSGSMTFAGLTGKSKGEEIEIAVKQVIERLLNSKNKNSFDINIWAYADESVNVLKTASVNPNHLSQSINPCEYIEKYNGTNLTSTLVSIKKECEQYLTENKDKNTQALVIILSDGAIDDYKDCSKLCDQIKMIEKVTVASNFFESKNLDNFYDNKELKKEMENLASSSSLFTSTLDPEEIRKHMIKSISTLSKID